MAGDRACLVTTRPALRARDSPDTCYIKIKPDTGSHQPAPPAWHQRETNNEKYSNNRRGGVKGDQSDARTMAVRPMRGEGGGGVVTLCRPGSGCCIPQPDQHGGLETGETQTLSQIHHTQGDTVGDHSEHCFLNLSILLEN